MGGIPFELHPQYHLIDFMHEMGVVDLSLTGTRLTWCNKIPQKKREFTRD